MLRTEFRSFASELLTSADAELTALRSGDREFSRAALTELVEHRRTEIDLPTRSVVVLRGSASVDWVTSYLALLADGHVPVLAGDHVERLVAAWSPAAVIRADGDHWSIDRLADPTTPAVELHPDLAVLLSTSGSTGHPKLVRLSHENLSANARSIAGYLQLTPDDRAITTLPLHYCYGLSVLHSHLVSGASVVLSTASVVDPCFREALVRHRVSNIAGVPHTFELLEQSDPDAVLTPWLRFMTQAGGRLAPEAVTRWHHRTQLHGVDFFVMYGQTEATARMAYLPPALVDRHPEAIGVPIDGGSFRLEPVDDDLTDGVLTDDLTDGGAADAAMGELIYRGPNVMLGYATAPSDLALGRTVDELRTGDLARYHEIDGVYEIVGRRARFVKPFGLRIDLDALEAELRDGSPALRNDVAVSGDDAGLIVAAPDADDAALLAELVRRTGLPPAAIGIETTRPIPRTASGKVDHREIVEHHRSRCAEHERDVGDRTADSVIAVYRRVLGRHDIDPADSFVSLGGDSLSYIECSVRLEAVLGRLPADWHLQPISRLEPGRPRRFLAPVDTTVALRALGICLVVATHMHLSFVPGGAHLLLAVVGYNLSRFILPIEPTRDRLMAGLRSAARVAVPTVLWVAGGLVVGAGYGIGTLLLANNYLGPASHAGDHWHFWFIEVVVHVVLALSVLLAIPGVRRAERRWPYLAPLVVLGLLLALRMEWAWMGDWYNLRFRTHGVAWFVALGWLVQRSQTNSQRLLTAAVCVVSVTGFFDYPPRERLIIASLLVLLVFHQLLVPRLLVLPLATLASASMWIYISHFTIWPPLVDALGIRWAYVPTILAGIAVWALAEYAVRRLPRPWSSPTRSADVVVRIA
jgi:acyl-coenzyme A synthetase/AMP-(fatty) acid ligase